MLGVDVRLWAVSLDQELIVAIRLDVQVALACIADDLHREIVRHALVQQLFAIRHPDLCALVTNDRAIEPQLPGPRQRARKGPSGGGDDRDA